MYPHSNGGFINLIQKERNEALKKRQSISMKVSQLHQHRVIIISHFVDRREGET